MHDPSLGDPVIEQPEPITLFLPILEASLRRVGIKTTRDEMIRRFMSGEPRVVIVAGAVVNVDSVLGDHVIVNTAATVDHDCVIGSYAHLAPGTNLAGGVAIGDGTLVGVGAAVIPLVSIGRWTTIGAGAVVTEDIPDDVTAKGIPARW